MTGPIRTRDWKYMRTIHDELLNELCSRILQKAVEIAAAEQKRPHQRFLELYDHLRKSDRIVAECFDDWRRSNIDDKIVSLRYRRLLTDDLVNLLAEQAQDWLHKVESIMKH